MIRKLKVLGLALVAVLAMSAMTASAASAAPIFTSGDDQTTVTANQLGTGHVFEVTGLKVTCTTAHFQSIGTIGTTATEVTMKPTYTGCTAKLGVFNVNATVTGFGHFGEANTCHYVIRANKSAGLSCAAGTEVTVDAGTCTVHIGATNNGSLGTITYTTGLVSGVHDLTAKINLVNINVSHTDGFGCPFEGNGNGAIGSLTGESTVTGKEPLGNPTGVTWHE